MAVKKASKTTPRKKRIAKPSLFDTLLVEVAWEVCNQVGGIYTVIRSKIQAVKQKWGDNYLLIGPLLNPDIDAEIEEIEDLSDEVGKTVALLRGMGFEVKYGIWLVIGRPKVVLLKPLDAYNKLDIIKQNLSNTFGIEPRNNDDLYNQVLAFSELTKVFFTLLEKEQNKQGKLTTAHFHEWMSVIPAMWIKNDQLNIKTVFTTHATLLGRYLAMNEETFYSHLNKFDWEAEAKRFNLLSMVQIEKKGAELADVFTTVSDLTGRECKYLLNKAPVMILPNGLNIKRFSVSHEVQNLHQQYKDDIHEFVMGHFFQSYPFNLDKTLYFFTSGRFEFRNKGYDITLKALKLLNERLKKEDSDITIVTFFVTKRPVWSINPDVLQSRGVMEEIRRSCDNIIENLREKLFYAAAASEKDHRLPDLNEMVDDYWRLRYRRTIQSWKKNRWPIIVTHNLVNDLEDEVLGFLRKESLINSPDDKVKVVYHPDFINPTNPLFGVEYSDFVRGCHLGIFPSYYEPWGYTPLECIALGVPTITSDLSGFGDYIQSKEEEPEKSGVFVLQRAKKTDEIAAEDLATLLYEFAMSSRRSRISLRNKSEDMSEKFDWSKLILEYEKAYRKAHKTNLSKN
ncbi:MAG: glycosyltransferase [Cyclobacteriaceae bacterium]|nr:glycosyltransferase [Cyclobacteriaceae bacterium]